MPPVWKLLDNPGKVIYSSSFGIFLVRFTKETFLAQFQLFHKFHHCLLEVSWCYGYSWHWLAVAPDLASFHHTFIGKNLAQPKLSKVQMLCYKEKVSECKVRQYSFGNINPKNSGTISDKISYNLESCLQMSRNSIENFANISWFFKGILLASHIFCFMEYLNLWW